MTRKPEPSFSLKQATWDIAATVGMENFSAVYRDIEHKIRQLHKNDELVGEEIPDVRTVRRIIELDIQRLPQEVVVSKLPPHVWHLRNDYEKIKILADNMKKEQEASKEARTKEETYKETDHKQKMRELAKAMAERISIPSYWNRDLVQDLPIEFQPGKYSLTIGLVEIGADKQIRVNYYDIRAGIAEPHLVKGLYSHLRTSGLPKFAELVGNKGKLNNWVGEVGQYSEALLKFLKLISDEVEVYKAKIYFHDEAKPGLTRWFIITAWNDALQKANDYPWIGDSWYHPPESILNTGLWQLKCGAYGIGIAKSKRTLKTYKNWHKELRVKYAEHQSAKDIHAKSQELSNVAQEIRQRLQEFSDMERLPGNCELC